MEIGNEISQKIRSAIKAKLVDLGSYVDDELPDYIMVMVANKKSKAQMTDDLNLFLGANTDVFTSWLHDVLSKLETATVTPSAGEKEKPPLPDKEKPADKEQPADKEKPADKQKPAEKEKPAESGSGKKSKKSKKSKDKDKSGHHKSSRRKDKDKDKHGSSSKKSTESEKVIVTTKSHEPAAVPSQTEATIKETSAILTTDTTATADAVIVAEPQAKVAPPKQAEQPAEAIISLNPETHDFLDEEIDEESKKEDKLKKPSSSKTALKTRSAPVSRSRTTSAPVSRSRTSSTSPASSKTKSAAAKVEPASPPAVKVTKRTVEKTIVSRPRSSSAGATLSSITVVPKPERKRKGPGSVLGQVIQAEDDNEDGPSPGKKVASTVELHRRPSLPVSKQANTSLLKKAVSAAQESTKDVVVTAPVEAASQPVPMVVQQSRPQLSQKRFKLIRTTSSSGAQKTLLVRAVNEANESTISARPVSTRPTAMTTAMAPVRMQYQQTPPAATTLYQRASAITRMDVPKTGLVSRSRLREVAERDYDTQEFMTVEESSDPQQVQMEEYYADDEEQEEEMEATVDSRHIFVETTPRRAPTHVTAGRAVEVMEHKVAGYSSSSPESDVMVVIDPKSAIAPAPLPAPAADKHVVVQREKPIPPRPVSPKFIVTLDGPPPKSGKNKKTKAKAAARIAPRMDITRTIDNSGTTVPSMQPLETEFIQSVVTTTYQDDYIPSIEQQTEYVYVPSQMSPTAQTVFSPAASMTMVADAEQVTLSRQLTLEEQSALEQVQQSESTGKRQQASERCRFWPACKNGNDCPFVHPTQPCKTFPKCKFGDKCVFIHPNCKFDARCTKTNCPFTHASRRSPSAPPPPRPVPRIKVTPPQSRGPSQTVCRFFPKCVNMDCTFLHPKPCRFGRSCNRKDCMFMHPQVATGAALRWSSKEKEKHISERGFAVKTAEQQILPS